MKQTAVNWVHSKILLRIGLDDNDIIELRTIVKEAIEMEKEQIEETYKDGWNAGDFGSDCWEEIYYKETFKQD
jgi:hypothetical protein